LIRSAIDPDHVVERSRNRRILGCHGGLPDDMPAMFRPLQELENLAPATWYVNVLAAYHEHRGKGHGTALFGLAERLAADVGRRGLSIIVSDANLGARRLYERCGYRETARPAQGEGELAEPQHQLAAAGEEAVMLLTSTLLNRA
jgi:GNAT superfamily N-acetyltransferase